MGEFLISPAELYARLGHADAPVILDVCKCDDYDRERRLIPSARWRDQERADEWVHDLPRGRQVVAVCVKGMKVSQSVAAVLRLQGIDAAALEGGNEAWRSGGFPTVAKRLGVGNRESRPTRWVTRVRPKIDRIACPWLVSRFIDPAAQFFYVAADQVIAAAGELSAIPYDVSDVEIAHRGENCSFDALIADFDIRDAGLDRVALVVRGADTARPDLAPEAAGLLAISLGRSRLAGPDDHAALRHGFAVYDALYAWARMAASETRDRPTAIAHA